MTKQKDEKLVERDGEESENEGMRVSFTIPKPLAAKVRKAAREEEMLVSELIRSVLRKELED